MSSIQSLLESANPWKSLQSDASKLATKWSKNRPYLKALVQKSTKITWRLSWKTKQNN